MNEEQEPTDNGVQLCVCYQWNSDVLGYVVTKQTKKGLKMGGEGHVQP